MRIVKTFIARDVDGKEYTIHELQGKHEAIGPDGRRTMVPDALRELRTDRDKAVDHISQGVYNVINTFDVIRVTSDDANAP